MCALDGSSRGWLESLPPFLIPKNGWSWHSVLLTSTQLWCYWALGFLLGWKANPQGHTVDVGCLQPRREPLTGTWLDCCPDLRLQPPEQWKMSVVYKPLSLLLQKSVVPGSLVSAPWRTLNDGPWPSDVALRHGMGPGIYDNKPSRWFWCVLTLGSQWLDASCSEWNWWTSAVRVIVEMCPSHLRLLPQNLLATEICACPQLRNYMSTQGTLKNLQYSHATQGDDVSEWVPTVPRQLVVKVPQVIRTEWPVLRPLV